MNQPRTRGATAAAIGVVAALLSVPVAAEASPAACQGQAATVVGSPGSTVSGTAGVDVVVTNGARSTSTGDGDDVVCVTGAEPDGKRVRVWTGSGDDHVEVTAADDTSVVLGVGADTFRGGPHSDRVYTGELEELSEQGDLDVDDVLTGAGDDYVLSGQDGSADPNRDVVDLGDGDDVASMAGGSGTAEGGAGDDTLAIRTGDDEGPGTWVLDNRNGTAARDGVVHWTWHGFTRFDVKHLGYSQDLLVIGSDRAEAFFAEGRGSDAGPVSVSAGGGRDLVSVNSSHRGTIDGQSGQDRLQVFANPTCGPRRCGSLLLDLAGGVARTSGDGGKGRFQVRGVESAAAVDLGTVVLKGSRKPNRLSAESSCHVRLLGGAGSDVLRLVASPTGCQQNGGTAPSALLAGGPGDDVLLGGRFDDTLLGGAGRDRADGARGRDRCVAEIRIACERA